MEQALQMIEGLVCLYRVLAVSDTFERSDDPFVSYPNAVNVLESRQPDESLFDADDGVGVARGDKASSVPSAPEACAF